MARKRKKSRTANGGLRGSRKTPAVFRRNAKYDSDWIIKPKKAKDGKSKKYSKKGTTRSTATKRESVKTSPIREKETTRKRTRQTEEWESLDFVLDEYIQEMDLTEDDIGGSP